MPSRPASRFPPGAGRREGRLGQADAPDDDCGESRSERASSIPMGARYSAASRKLCGCADLAHARADRRSAVTSRRRRGRLGRGKFTGAGRIRGGSRTHGRRADRRARCSRPARPRGHARRARDLFVPPDVNDRLTWIGGSHRRRRDHLAAEHRRADDPRWRGPGAATACAKSAPVSGNQAAVLSQLVAHATERDRGSDRARWLSDAETLRLPQRHRATATVTPAGWITLRSRSS